MEVAAKYGNKFDGLSEDAIQGLAYFAYVRQVADGDAVTALDRIGALFKGSKFPLEEVNGALEMVNTISRMGDDYLKINGGDRIVKMLGALGDARTNPIGAVHTLNDIKATDSLSNFSHFEFDEFAPYFTELAKVNGARRTDFKIVNADGSVLRVEYKGSKAAKPGNPFNKHEVLNDVMILLDKGEDFVWVLDKGHDLSKTAKFDERSSRK